MITVVDYGRGNLFSLGQALGALDLRFRFTDKADELAGREIIILPGVGAFGDAMEQLRRGGLDEAIVKAAAGGARILGICLGMQLLATRSKEFGDHEGLNLIAGEVRRLPDPAPRTPDPCRIPNIGWRRTTLGGGFAAAVDLDDAPYFYFVHSFSFYCADPADLAGTIDVNGTNVAAIVGRGNIWGFQFHPEKSGQAGLTLLDRVLRAGSL